jgi:hypothetical protein
LRAFLHWLMQHGNGTAADEAALVSWLEGWERTIGEM